MRALGKKPHFWPLKRLKKVLLTAQGCARLRKAAHWPNKNANPLRLSEKKVYCGKKSAICAILREKTSFLAFPEAIKGVVDGARLRKAAHWPNNNANPLGLSEKKVYCVEKRDMCDP